MQFALQDLRKWGYKKILMNFYTTAQGRSDFLDSIRKSNNDLYNIKCSAYSFPRKKDSANEGVMSYYSGMNKFIHFCEPMIDNIEIDVACQRKFRNQWDSLWKNVAKDLELSSQDEKVLSDFGIRICFCDDLSDISEEILSFLNYILIWSIFVQSETNFDSVSLSPLDIIDMLITSSSEEFVATISLFQ